MAYDYSISTNRQGTKVTFTVTGVKRGDVVRIFLRYDPDPGYMLKQEDHTAAGSTFSVTYDITPGMKYGCNVTVNGGTALGLKTFTAGKRVDRPADWAWDGIYSGAPITNLTGLQWNRFTARINEFRRYLGYDERRFTEVSNSYRMRLVSTSNASSYIRLSSVVSEALIGIQDLPGHGSLPNSYDIKSAYFFQQLANALNAIE